MKEPELTVREIRSGKRRFLPLLLAGDESERMISRYLDGGRLFAGYRGADAIAVCAVTEEAPGLVEVKNLAVHPAFRRRGYGRYMLRHVERLYAGRTVRLGTGESPATLGFYQACGYVYSHRVPDFFTTHYDRPIVEEGVVLKDMVYLQKKAR